MSVKWNRSQDKEHGKNQGEQKNLNHFVVPS